MSTREPARNHQLADERIDYTAGSLEEQAIDAVGAQANPFALLSAWMEDAFARRDSHHDISDPSAVVLSTVDTTGPAPRPRSRTVLVKDIIDDQGPDGGVVVYTNKESAKGLELAADPWAAMLLPHLALQRQVRIEGVMVDAGDAAADAYWASRPRASQLGGWASDQSRPVASRAAMDERYAEVEQRFADVEEITRPPHWGGYRLIPERVEFWQGRPGRFHDRIVFTRDLDPATGMAGPWSRERLQP